MSQQSFQPPALGCNCLDPISLQLDYLQAQELIYRQVSHVAMHDSIQTYLCCTQSWDQC